ncbi:hypothetical protein CERZMDRAFT_82893 [Cercospora zeae-maydis SCOH1-5]|uniref:BZIP domain-containing protein n=1 Tax=Cercospora zeae-maydis SCOH1-5 TaxID=717836 RepID=A0A6A6FNP8_9PEZI|nr:hypothetical protein CERZMDRAFT_82893 [Cercospora zeae-maydis SCOH1-5]
MLQILSCLLLGATVAFGSPVAAPQVNSGPCTPERRIAGTAQLVKTIESHSITDAAQIPLALLASRTAFLKDTELGPESTIPVTLGVTGDTVRAILVSAATAINARVLDARRRPKTQRLLIGIQNRQNKKKKKKASSKSTTETTTSAADNDNEKPAPAAAAAPEESSSSTALQTALAATYNDNQPSNKSPLDATEIPTTYCKTEAQRRYEERRRKRLEERLQREGVKTHKERVQELNKYLSTLSEHNDMPRIGPG